MRLEIFRLRSRFRWSIFFWLTVVLSLFLGNWVVYAAASPWTQTNWSGGSGQTNWLDSTKFNSSSNVTIATAGQVTLQATTGWCNNTYCNTNWQYRRKITFDNTTTNIGVTSVALTNFPVMVKVDSSRISYANTQNSGQDIRFVDPDGTDLAYEIEKWDESGTSSIWVKVPQVDGNANTDYIYLYYGNSSAADHQQINAVWSDSYTGVWHLGDDPSLTTDGYCGGGSDETCNSAASNYHGDATNGSFTSGDSVAGKIYNGVNFNAAEYFSLNSLSLVDATFTLSGWFKRNSGGCSTMFGQGSGGSTSKGLLFGAGDTNIITCSFWNNDLDVSFSVGTGWHYYQCTYNASTNARIIYSDGAAIGNDTASVDYSGTGTMYLGHLPWGGGCEPQATMDEVRVSSVARPPAYIAASFHVDTDDYNTFAAEESVYTVGSGTLTSSIFDTEFSANWGNLTYTVTAPANTTTTVKVRTSNSSTMSGATDFSSCNAISSGTDISDNNCVTDGQRYIQYELTIANSDSVSTPTFQDISLAFTNSDSTPPSISLTPLSPDPNSDNTPSLGGTASDVAGTVTDVEFQMDGTGGSWTNCSADDAAFDESSEPFTCAVTASLSDGSHTMYVHATDSNGNTTTNEAATTDTFTIFTPVISVTVSDGNVTYGKIPLNTEKDTTVSGVNETQTVTNNGNVTENFNIKTSTAVGGTTWSVGVAAGNDTYVQSFSTNTGSSWEVLDLANNYETLATGISAAGTVNLDLKIRTPTNSSDYEQKTITITVQAVAG